MTLPLLYTDAHLAAPACEIAARFGFSITDLMPESGCALQLGETGLALLTLGRNMPGPVLVDFVTGAADWRRKHGGGRGQGVAKACGLKGGATPHVLDATAGLGRDAFVLAGLGCRVDMLERSPVAAALLDDGLRRGLQAADVAPVLQRMRLHYGSSLDLLGNWMGERPQVVYLDPMFPEKAKSALSKKDMQAFQAVVGADLDADALLEPARALAQSRVAVKRPRHAPWLAGQKPSFSLDGDSVRFDIYLPVPAAA